MLPFESGYGKMAVYVLPDVETVTFRFAGTPVGYTMVHVALLGSSDVVVMIAAEPLSVMRIDTYIF